MKLTETCPCGGSIDLAYTQTGLRSDRENERADGLKQLNVWRRAHKPCLKRLGEAASPSHLPEEGEPCLIR